MELVDMPSIIEMVIEGLSINEVAKWVSPIMDFMKDGSLPNKGAEAHKVKPKSLAFASMMGSYTQSLTAAFTYHVQGPLNRNAL